MAGTKLLPSGGPGAVVVAIGAALVACGGGDSEGGPRGEERAAPGGGDTEQRRPVPSARDGSSEEAEAPASPERPCRFVAPAGRLAVGVVRIELVRTPCEQGRRLAAAVVLGQPAGANRPVARDGFRCRPSSTKPGLNVTYSCSREGRSARFRVVWSR
jgi:hypothetical protein